MDESSDQTAVSQTKLLSKVIGYLKEYPFLLITVAGLIILTSTLAFDIEKLKEVMPLLYAVVLIPIFMQFYFEARKHNHSEGSRSGNNANPVNHPVANSSENTNQPVIVNRKYSTKVIVSVIFIVLCFIVYGDSTEEELLDEELQYGLILFSGIALWLAISGRSEVKRNEALGHKLSITAIALSSLVLLSSLGWLVQALE